MRVGLIGILFFLSLGCSSSPEVSGDPLGPEIVRKVSDDWIPVPDPVRIYGVVVDDTDDLPGSEARARVFHDLQEILTKELRVGRDPARYDPTDVRLAFAFPTFVGSPRIVSWSNHPGLRWKADFRRGSDLDALIEEAARVVEANVHRPSRPTSSARFDAPLRIEQVLSEPHWVYAPVNALNQLAEYLTTMFCPSDSRADAVTVGLHLISARDDLASSSGLSRSLIEYQYDLEASCYLELTLHAIGDNGNGWDGSRLAAFAQDAHLYLEEISFYLARSSNLFQRFPCCGGYGSPCNSWPYDRRPDGAWMCQQLVFAVIDACDPERGWRDPTNDDGVREPAFDEQGRRICEVDQLKGRDRELCETSLDCEGCAPGWCIPTVPELQGNPRCSADTAPIRGGFRFVGKSSLGPTPGRHRGACVQVREH